MMHTIKVLYMNHTASLGGGELALVGLLSSVNRTKVTPSVLLFEDGPLRERLEAHAPVTVCPLNARVLRARRGALGLSLWSRLRDVPSTVAFLARLRRAIRESNADLVHTNSLKADILGGIAARLSGIPVIWHVRDRIANDYLPTSVVKVFQLLTRAIPHYVIANSEATLSTLHRAPGDRSAMGGGEARFRSRSCAIHDGVREVPARLGQTMRECVVVGLVGRISPWKGQDVFLRAAAMVYAHYPNTVFRIIGSPLFGEDAYAESLRRLCGELGLGSSVEFTGFVTDVAGAIADLDILVHASTIAEPFGQVIIEGMAAGKPVVATNGGGVPEIVVDQVTGCLVPMKDEGRMAEAILKLIEDANLRRTMGANGKKRVEHEFRIEQTAEKVQQVYVNVLGKSRKEDPATSRLRLSAGLRAAESGPNAVERL